MACRPSSPILDACSTSAQRMSLTFSHILNARSATNIQGLQELKSSVTCPEKRLEALPVSKGPAVSSSLLARRSKINSRDSCQGEPLLRGTENLQKSGESSREIGDTTRSLQVREK